MTLRKQVKTKETLVPQTVSDWSIADLASLYSVQRSSLISQARRILYSEADANKVVQEAFLKFVLAAPELDNRDRALAYLRTTVNNLSFNLLRTRKTILNVIPIDSDLAQSNLDQISYNSHISFDEQLVAAEDAAIIREALSRLSQDQRTALVMWEMEGRSTQEIATAIGTTPENVRHVVARSRSSFVRILSGWIINEETGLTALESLSSSYKKFSEIATKSSTMVVVAIFLFATLFGFNSLNSQNKPSKLNQITKSSNLNPIKKFFNLAKPLDKTLNKNSIANSNTIVTTNSNESSIPYATIYPKLEALSSYLNSITPSMTYAGVNSNGVPSGFTATDLNGNTGELIIGNPTSVVSNKGIVLNAPVMSFDPKAVNVALNQTIVVTGNSTTYTAIPSVSINGGWVALNVSSTNTQIDRLSNGDYLISITLNTPSAIDASVFVAVARGVDVFHIPSSISARILMNDSKTKILGEAVKVNAIGISK